MDSLQEYDSVQMRVDRKRRKVSKSTRDQKTRIQKIQPSGQVFRKSLTEVAKLGS